MADNFDSPWKSALKRNLADFLAFFFEQVWMEIDWRRPPRLRDKESNDRGSDGRPRMMIADLLVSVFLHDGREVLLHIEVQAQRDPKLAQRVLDYNYSLFKDYGQPGAVGRRRQALAAGRVP
jgi:hypothetical protein